MEDRYEDHYDEEMDIELIQEQLIEKILPVLEMLANRIKDNEDRTRANEELLTKLITGASDAVGVHKKRTLMGSLTENYGDKFGDVKEIYSDFMGRDMIEDIVQSILDNNVDEEGRDGYVNSFLNQVKSRFGKYAKKPDEAPQAAVEIEIEKTGGEPEPESEEPQGDGVDTFIKNMRKGRA